MRTTVTMVPITALVLFLSWSDVRSQDTDPRSEPDVTAQALQDDETALSERISALEARLDRVADVLGDVRDRVESKLEADDVLETSVTAPKADIPMEVLEDLDERISLLEDIPKVAPKMNTAAPVAGKFDKYLESFLDNFIKLQADIGILSKANAALEQQVEVLTTTQPAGSEVEADILALSEANAALEQQIEELTATHSAGSEVKADILALSEVNVLLQKRVEQLTAAQTVGVSVDEEALTMLSGRLDEVEIQLEKESDIALAAAVIAMLCPDESEAAACAVRLSGVRSAGVSNKIELNNEQVEKIAARVRMVMVPSYDDTPPEPRLDSVPVVSPSVDPEAAEPMEPFVFSLGPNGVLRKIQIDVQPQEVALDIPTEDRCEQMGAWIDERSGSCIDEKGFVRSREGALLICEKKSGGLWKTKLARSSDVACVVSVSSSN